MSISIVKSIIKRRLEKCSYTFILKCDILDKITLNNTSSEPNPLILFYPNSNYWVLLTNKYIQVYKNEKQTFIYYENIINDSYYVRFLGLYDIKNQEKILYDIMRLEWVENNKKRKIDLQIETGSIYSFCDGVSFLKKIMDKGGNGLLSPR